MSTERLFAGLDVSTQSCKLVVIDVAAAAVVSVDAVNYDDDLPRFETRDGLVRGLPHGAAESNPLMWLAAIDAVLERLANSAVPVAAIRSISVSAQQHGLVALDEQGRLTRPTSKLWHDHSTVEECRILTERVGGRQAMIEAIGNTQRPGYTAGKILHFRRHEPEAYERTAQLMVVHDFANRYLTDGVVCTEPGDAAATALWNAATGEWSREVIDAIDSGLSAKLPEVRSATRSVGAIGRSLVERFGFSPNCTIDAGCGDNMLGALGTGVVRPGVVTVTLGTSGTICTVLDEPFVDPEGEIAAYADSTGRFLPLLCVSNLANVYNELRRSRRLSHAAFDRAAVATPPNADAGVVLPWFAGERTPDLPRARPVFFGIPLEDLGGERLCRAVLDGLVLNLHAGYERFPAAPGEIRVTGGLSRSDAWCQTVADVFGVEVVPVEGEGAALGAALHAAWVWLAERGEAVEIEELIEPFVVLDSSRRKRPAAEHAAAYAALRRRFRAVSRRLRGLEGEDPFDLSRREGYSPAEETR